MTYGVNAEWDMLRCVGTSGVGRGLVAMRALGGPLTVSAGQIWKERLAQLLGKGAGREKSQAASRTLTSNLGSTQGPMSTDWHLTCSVATSLVQATTISPLNTARNLLLGPLLLSLHQQPE